MSLILRKAAAFIRRDFQIESSYKLNFVMGVIDSLVILVFFFFLDKLMEDGSSRDLARYGGDYLSFVLIGLAFARFFQLTLKMFSDSIRQAQVTGCLEAMLSSQTDSLTIVLMSSLYGLLAGAVQLVIILVAGALFAGGDFSHINVPATLLVFALSVLSFVAFGVLSAAAILWLKKGDPFSWILGGLGTMLGGAYFPISVLPGWMQKVAFLIPITHSLDALRMTMLLGFSVEQVARPLLILGLMSAILLPISLFVFASLVHKGRKDGTLMQYLKSARQTRPYGADGNGRPFASDTGNPPADLVTLRAEEAGLRGSHRGIGAASLGVLSATFLPTDRSSPSFSGTCRVRSRIWRLLSDFL